MTHFQTKTAQNHTLWGGTYLYIAYIGEHPFFLYRGVPFSPPSPPPLPIVNRLGEFRKSSTKDNVFLRTNVKSQKSLVAISNWLAQPHHRAGPALTRPQPSLSLLLIIICKRLGDWGMLGRSTPCAPLASLVKY